MNEPLPALRDSLLHRFVDESIAYEETGAPIPRPLLLYATAGGAAMVLAAFSITIWPSPHTIAHSGFFLIAKAALAGFVATLKVLALPLALTGVTTLAITGYLYLRPRRRIGWHYACVGELVAGAGSLGASALVFVAIVATVIIWMLIFTAGLALLGRVLIALAE